MLSSRKDYDKIKAVLFLTDVFGIQLVNNRVSYSRAQVCFLITDCVYAVARKLLLIYDEPVQNYITDIHYHYRRSIVSQRVVYRYSSHLTFLPGVSN